MNDKDRNLKIIVIAYLMILLKMFNVLTLQYVGFAGYFLLTLALSSFKQDKRMKVAFYSTIVTLVLLLLPPNMALVESNPSMVLIISIVKSIIYSLATVLTFYNIGNYLVDNLVAEDSYVKTQQNKIKRLIIIFVVSILCQNIVIFIGNEGALFFLIGILLTIYYNIASLVFIRKQVKNV